MWYMTGPCYCESIKGNISSNGVICFRNTSFERFDYCLTNEYCVGPDNPDDAIRFSRDTFCKKGKFLLCYHYCYSILKLYRTFRFVILMTFLIFMWGIYSCDGSIEYPDCSFCPINNNTNAVNGCNGNCRLNSHTNFCEFKGMAHTDKSLVYYDVG